MSKQQRKSDSKLPNNQSDGLVVSTINLEDDARHDASLDGPYDHYKAFRARLIQLAGAVTNKHVVDIVEGFGRWVDQSKEKFNAMPGTIPGDSDVFISGLEMTTMGNLATAGTTHSTKIVPLEKEKNRWKKRFPNLGQNLDEPPSKNAFLLIGLVLFLIALESIANSRFFAEGSELGLVGGALTAITVSMGNVLIPLGLAFFGHRWFYRYDSYRNFGILMIALFLLWALGFNHIVAQYRESLVAVADNDASTLNYALLFGLGTAVAGISFWKMWSFLDPFKQARKCIDNLERAKKEYAEAVCGDLTRAQKKYGDICVEINTMDAEISAEFPSVDAKFELAHGKVIHEMNNVFANYHRQYCAMKVDPDPKRPVVTAENRVDNTNDEREFFLVTEYSAGITDNDWTFFHAQKTLLERQIEKATDTWIPKLQDILRKINDLIIKFKEVIIAKLLEWEKQGNMA